MSHPTLASVAVVAGAVGAALGLLELWLSRNQKLKQSDMVLTAFVWLDDRKDPVQFCLSLRVPVTVVCVIIGIGDALNGSLSKTSWRSFDQVSFVVVTSLLFLGTFWTIYPRFMRAVATADSQRQFFLRLASILILGFAFVVAASVLASQVMSWSWPEGDGYTRVLALFMALYFGAMETAIVVWYSAAFMIGLLALFYLAKFATFAAKVTLCRVAEDSRSPILWLSTLLGLIAKAIG